MSLKELRKELDKMRCEIENSKPNVRWKMYIETGVGTHEYNCFIGGGDVTRIYTEQEVDADPIPHAKLECMPTRKFDADGNIFTVDKDGNIIERIVID